MYSVHFCACLPHNGEKAGEYLAVLIDDPALPQSIRANLFRDDNAGSVWSLLWTRTKPRDERD